MTPALTLYLLEKEHPRTLQAIQTRIQTMFPKTRMEDLSLVPKLLVLYCKHRDIPYSLLKGNGGKLQVARYRREFAAVLLLCYQPERLLEITDRTMHCLPGSLAEATKCCMGTGKAMLQEAPVHYRVYKDFKEAVDTVHGKIEEELDAV